MSQPVGARIDRGNRYGKRVSVWPPRWVILIVLGLAAPLSFLYLNQTSGLAATSYDVAALQDDKKLWEMRNEQLRLEVSQLESLDRIDRLAASRLGMGPPQHQVYINAPASTAPPTVIISAPAAPTHQSSVLWIIQQLIGKR